MYVECVKDEEHLNAVANKILEFAKLRVSLSYEETITAFRIGKDVWEYESESLIKDKFINVEERSIIVEVEDNGEIKHFEFPGIVINDFVEALASKMDENTTKEDFIVLLQACSN